MFNRFSSLVLFCVGMVTAACWQNDGKKNSPEGTPGYSWRLHEFVEALVYVSWPQEPAGRVHVEYQLDEKWVATPAFDAPAGEVERLVAGIPYGTEASWRVVQADGTHKPGPPITTGPFPKEIPIPSVTVSNEAKWLPSGKYLLSSINKDTSAWMSGTFWTYIMDRQGRFVWAKKTPLKHWTLYAQVAITGDRIIYDEATKWTDFDSGENSQVHFSYLDKPIESVATPGLHHAFVQLPDGALAWGSKYHEGGEAIVEKTPEATRATVVWTVEDDWPSVSSNVESNCLYYNEATDSYLYSFYSNDSIVEVDRATGTSLWWAGGTDDGYTFSPEKSQFDWQHGVSYTQEGTLLVSTKVDMGENHSTFVREYTLDHDSETLTEIWSYDSGVHARYNGDAWRLENGNTLHIVGSAGHIVEVDESGTAVWRVEFPEQRLLGRGEFISDLYALVSPI